MVSAKKVVSLSKIMDKDTPTLYLDLLGQAASRKSCLEGSCHYFHVTTYNPEVAEMLTYRQWKVDGSIFIILRRGSATLLMNTDKIELSGPVAIGLHHSSIIQFMECSEDLDVHILSYSTAFMQEINISFTSFSGEAIMGRNENSLRLNEDEADYVLRYFELINDVMSHYLNAQLARHTISNLTSALFYQLVEMIYNHTEFAATEGKSPQRQLTYVHDFIKLVHLHFAQERTVSFYAGKLFISPKYLSLLVKEATGRSAAQWIDHHVVVEAKNLLRYSGKNIQQIAYSLNFSNQSSFGKYFKHLTGMSPTEYQKSTS